jgi:hypothetical protein
MRHIGTGALMFVLVGLLAVGLSCGGLEEEAAPVGALSAAPGASDDGGVAAKQQSVIETWFPCTVPGDNHPSFELFVLENYQYCDWIEPEYMKQLICNWNCLEYCQLGGCDDIETSTSVGACYHLPFINCWCHCKAWF